MSYFFYFHLNRANYTLFEFDLIKLHDLAECSERTRLEVEVWSRCLWMMSINISRHFDQNSSNSDRLDFSSYGRKVIVIAGSIQQIILSVYERLHALKSLHIGDGGSEFGSSSRRDFSIFLFTISYTHCSKKTWKTQASRRRYVPVDFEYENVGRFVSWSWSCCCFSYHFAISLTR